MKPEEIERWSRDMNLVGQRLANEENARRERRAFAVRLLWIVAFGAALAVAYNMGVAHGVRRAAERSRAFDAWLEDAGERAETRAAAMTNAELLATERVADVEK